MVRHFGNYKKLHPKCRSPFETSGSGTVELHISSVGILLEAENE